MSRIATARSVLELRAATPQPDIWPECGECGKEFVLSRELVVSRVAKAKGMGLDMRVKWTWVRGCKHKRTKKLDRIARERRKRP